LRNLADFGNDEFEESVGCQLLRSIGLIDTEESLHGISEVAQEPFKV
jgi:hypothetical protein